MAQKISQKELVTLRLRPTKNGGSAIHLDYSINGVRHREGLKMYLIPERTKLDKLKNQETLKAAEQIRARMIIDIQNGMAGRRKYTGDKVPLLQYMEERAQYYERRGTTYTQNVRSVMHYIEDYNGKVMLSQVDKDYITGFLLYLKNTGLGPGTLRTYFIALAIVLNSAVRDELIIDNPTKKIDSHLKPHEPDSHRTFLTLDELRRLMATPCRRENTKRAFLFACFTGLRVSDCRSLLWEEIVETEPGQYQIQKVQKKTGEMVYIPLSENAMRWLPERKPGGKVFSKIPTSNTLGSHLYGWAVKAGIKKHVTFHVARHTNATLMLTYGTDIYTVSKLLGHKSVQTTQVYGKIVDGLKRKAVDSIPDIGEM